MPTEVNKVYRRNCRFSSVNILISRRIAFFFTICTTLNKSIKINNITFMRMMISLPNCNSRLVNYNSSCKGGEILFTEIISFILICLFIDLFIVNFRHKNYAYTFVMFIGTLVFYGNFVHHLPPIWKSILMVIAIILWAIFTVSVGKQAWIHREKRYIYTTVLGIIAIITTIIFRLVL